MDEANYGKSFNWPVSPFELLGDENGIENVGDEVTDDLEEADEHDEIYNITPEQIIDAMQQLTPAYRTVFNLYVYEDYTHQDIAEALGISVGSSKSNYAKAKKNMKKLLIKNLHATKWKRVLRPLSEA